MGTSESSEADGARNGRLTAYGLGDAMCYRSRVDGTVADKGGGRTKAKSHEERENGNPEWVLEDSVRA